MNTPMFRLPPGPSLLRVLSDANSRKAIGLNVFSTLVDEANFNRHPRGTWIDFDVGQMVRHLESGHLAEVLDFDTSAPGVSYKLHWLTVDWRVSHWSGKGLVLACPLEALAAQAV